MSDEIKDRLTETSKNCIESYEAWNSNKKDMKSREELMEAVHELRRVAARLEIEIAVSERNERTSKPIPIPSHRSSRTRQQGDQDDNKGNASDDGGAKKKPRSSGGGKPRKSSAGSKS